MVEVNNWAATLRRAIACCQPQAGSTERINRRRQRVDSHDQPGAHVGDADYKSPEADRRGTGAHADDRHAALDDSLGTINWDEILKPSRWLIAVQELLEIFGYFLLVAIGVELLETLKAYVRKGVIHVRVVLEVALIAMARKVIIEEPNTVPGVTLFGITALILALGIAFFFERQSKRETGHEIL